METSATRQSLYALGHSEEELHRLSRQGQAFAPFTRQLLQEAGIAPGMHILDIGCGSGDVALLAAELVGTSGHVLGVDREQKAVDWATARVHALGLNNVKFLRADPADMPSGGEMFDAVIGRLVLMYYPNTVESLRKIVRHVRPGGLVVFQEFDTANCRSMPVAPLFDRSVGLIKQALSATGARIQLGLELYSVYLDAGLPGPCLRMDALIGGGPDCPAYGLVANVIQSLLPVMEKLNIATAAEVDIATLEQRMRDEVVAGKGVVLSPGLIGAWSRKP